MEGGDKRIANGVAAHALHALLHFQSRAIGKGHTPDRARCNTVLANKIGIAISQGTGLTGTSTRVQTDIALGRLNGSTLLVVELIKPGTIIGRHRIAVHTIDPKMSQLLGRSRSRGIDGTGGRGNVSLR